MSSDKEINPFTLEWYLQLLVFATYMRGETNSFKYARIESWLYRRILNKYNRRHYE